MANPEVTPEATPKVMRFLSVTKGAMEEFFEIVKAQRDY